MEKLRTAVTLKSAIETAAEKLEPIGTCPQPIWEYKREREYYYEDDEDCEELQLLNRVESLKKALEGCYYSEFELENPGGSFIQLGDITTTANISQLELKQLYEKADDSPYGDVKNLKTKIDKTVRSSKEIRDIEVDPNLILKIESEWSQTMYPKKVKVVPYKLNMYSKNDKFDEHLDTPDKNLVGTALISLWAGYTTSGLEISDIGRKHKHYWRPDSPSCIMFYTDCPHSVSRQYSNDIRATIAFKIYSVEETSDMKTEQLVNVIEALKPILNGGKIGFILEHGYSLETTAFTGSDALLISALQTMNKKIEVFSILYEFQLTSDHNYNEYDSFSSIVYPLRDVDVEYLTGSISSRPECKHQNILFYILNDKQLTWKNEHQDYVEHTGNESRPEEQNSIYLSRAVIIE